MSCDSIPDGVGPLEPVQHVAPRPDSSERALARAVLELALRDCRVPRGSLALAVEAWAWFADDSKAPWSARWLCDHLGVDLARVRRWVSQQEDRHRRRLAA